MVKPAERDEPPQAEPNAPGATALDLGSGAPRLHLSR